MTWVILAYCHSYCDSCGMEWNRTISMVTSYYFVAKLRSVKTTCLSGRKKLIIIDLIIALIWDSDNWPGYQRNTSRNFFGMNSWISCESVSFQIGQIYFFITHSSRNGPHHRRCFFFLRSEHISEHMSLFTFNFCVS